MSQEQCQAQSLVQAQDCYEVAAILDQKLMKKDGRLKKFYLIYWKGYPNECDHTWEPPENLRAVKDMIYQFEKRKRANPAKKERTKEGANRKMLKQTQVPEDSENSKQKGETKDSESASQKQRKLRKLQVSSPNKQETGTNNHISIQPGQKNEAKKKPQGKRNKNGKDEQKQTNKQGRHKRANPFLQESQQQAIDDAPTAKQPLQKAQPSKYGNIVNHCYQKGEMYYQVQMLSKQGSVKGTAVLVASKIRDECCSKIGDYLEKYIIQLEEWNRQLRS